MIIVGMKNMYDGYDDISIAIEEAIDLWIEEQKHKEKRNKIK